MDLENPLRDIAPGVRGALLGALAGLTQPVTRRQLAARAGVSPGHASTVIDDLIASGLVTEQRAGRSSLVRLNRAHLAAESILALHTLRGRLIARLRDDLSSWPDVRAAWLFGSVARGDATPASDIDLLIVADDLESAELHRRLSRLQADVRSWTGNEVQVVEHTMDSWAHLIDVENPLLVTLRNEGTALTPGADALLRRAR